MEQDSTAFFMGFSRLAYGLFGRCSTQTAPYSATTPDTGLKRKTGTRFRRCRGALSHHEEWPRRIQPGLYFAATPAQATA